MELKTKFNIGDIVQLEHVGEKYLGWITEIIVRETGVRYEVRYYSYDTERLNFEENELTKLIPQP